jgi:hypothetical protein
MGVYKSSGIFAVFGICFRMTLVPKRSWSTFKHWLIIILRFMG